MHFDASRWHQRWRCTRHLRPRRRHTAALALAFALFAPATPAYADDSIPAPSATSVSTQATTDPVGAAVTAVSQQSADVSVPSVPSPSAVVPQTEVGSTVAPTLASTAGQTESQTTGGAAASNASAPTGGGDIAVPSSAPVISPPSGSADTSGASSVVSTVPPPATENSGQYQSNTAQYQPGVISPSTQQGTSSSTSGSDASTAPQSTSNPPANWSWTWIWTCSGTQLPSEASPPVQSTSSTWTWTWIWESSCSGTPVTPASSQYQPPASQDQPGTGSPGSTATAAPPASSSAAPAQLQPQNTSIAVRVLSPGDNGAVTQTNSATSTAAASSVTSVVQSTTQSVGQAPAAQGVQQVVQGVQSVAVSAASSTLPSGEPPATGDISNIPSPPNPVVAFPTPVPVAVPTILPVIPPLPAIPLPTITVATLPDVPAVPLETAQETSVLSSTLGLLPAIAPRSPRIHAHSGHELPGSAALGSGLPADGAAATFGGGSVQKRLRTATADREPSRHLPPPELPDIPNSSGAASVGGGLGLLLLAFFAALTVAVALVPLTRSWLTWLIRDEPRIRPRAKERDRPG
jgi:hypothetical protein